MLVVAPSTHAWHSTSMRCVVDIELLVEHRLHRPPRTLRIVQRLEGRRAQRAPTARDARYPMATRGGDVPPRRPRRPSAARTAARSRPAGTASATRRLRRGASATRRTREHRDRDRRDRVEPVGAEQSRPKAATMTATEPSASATRCQNAPRTLRLPCASPRSEGAPGVHEQADDANDEHTGRVRLTAEMSKRGTASTTITIDAAISKTPFASATSTSVRPNPKVWRSVGGRSAMRRAAYAIASATTSETMCPASARRAREPNANPPTSSTTRKPALAPSANSAHAVDARRCGSRGGGEPACVRCR